jgi:hypothetical protein
MVRLDVTALAAFASSVSALQMLPMPISELAKQVRARLLTGMRLIRG